MSAPALTDRQQREESPTRRLAYTLLAAAVRGRRGRPGGTWGEAILAEFSETRGDWEAVRWAAGGLRAVWQERRARARHLPRHIRISRRVAAVVVVGTLAGLLVNQFALTVGYHPSGDMEPTVWVGDRYLLDKVSHRFTGVAHGDVVAVALPEGTVLKRVVGLPGDTIECRDGGVFRNGARLDEPYLPADPESARTDCRTVTVPPGDLYLLGDFRLVSLDSRHDVTYRQDAVQGRMLTRVWRQVG
ncbi:signal peptidase I [Actinoplanes sp. NPDC051346]|uniref:signal peptidase I n=1 Tax=Actinoplanes sp. NPDC051346 TaxID=3155048 RepID=UPI00342AEB94